MSVAPVDIAIVGAGAAGLATAIFVRELNPSCRVVLLEGAKKPGAKILVSGGGRCNVTNVRVSERDFWGGRAPIIRRILKGFTVEQTTAFFARLRVTLHEEADGKLFPDSNRARDVLDALVGEAARLGTPVVSGHRVLGIARTQDGFELSTAGGILVARHVVLATGGQSLPRSGSDGFGYELAKGLGHTIVPTTPALAPLVLAVTPGALHTRLSGVAHEAALTVWIDGRVSIRLQGSMLWTHFGISGPLALNLSRHWARARAAGATASVTLSFLPGTTLEGADRWLQGLAADRPRASLATLLATRLPASVADALVASIGADAAAHARSGRLQPARDRPASQLTREERLRAARALVEWPLAVTETRGYNYAEATAGGVSLDEIEPATMESRKCRGLFLVGEVLDVDGRIGGFNFQWAWASARTAGRSLAQRAARK